MATVDKLVPEVPGIAEVSTTEDDDGAVEVEAAPDGDADTIEEMTGPGAALIGAPREALVDGARQGASDGVRGRAAVLGRGRATAGGHRQPAAT